MKDETMWKTQRLIVCLLFVLAVLFNAAVYYEIYHNNMNDVTIAFSGIFFFAFLLYYLYSPKILSKYTSEKV